jgi:hypothetical protein
VAVVFQDRLEQASDDVFVVDYENARHGRYSPTGVIGSGLRGFEP